MNFLVTGGAGFIGSHVCERLLRAGHAVWAFDDLNSFYDPQLKRANIRELQSLMGSFEFVFGDLVAVQEIDDIGVQRRPLVGGHVQERPAGALEQGHDPCDALVRLPEGEAAPHEPPLLPRREVRRRVGQRHVAHAERVEPAAIHGRVEPVAVEEVVEPGVQLSLPAPRDREAIRRSSTRGSLRRCRA